MRDYGKSQGAWRGGYNGRMLKRLTKLNLKYHASRITFHVWPRLPLTPRLRNALVWLLSPKFSVGVTGLVQDERGYVLLLRHTYRPGREWGLPGGGLHPGESLEECLRREIREEVGIEVEISHLITVAAYSDRRLVDMIYACRPTPGQTLATFHPNPEIAEARYFPLDGLPDEMSGSQRRLIQAAIKQASEGATEILGAGRATR